jgi:hypothetical protein
MISPCITCKGLQKQNLPTNGAHVTAPLESIEWVNTALSDLRQSSATCRACALLLQGILLHHDRFSRASEDDVRVVAESFQPGSVNDAQLHLSLELRWRQCGDTCVYNDDEDITENHGDRYPDLKLEFFTDRGMFASQC